MDCVFCKIIKGEIPSTKVYEDEHVLAIKDIQPMAKVHIVMFPKEHILESSAEVNEENSGIIARIFEAIPKAAKAAGIFDDGYRVITNIGENGRQSVMHMHFHILGGELLSNELN